MAKTQVLEQSLPSQAREVLEAGAQIVQNAKEEAEHLLERIESSSEELKQRTLEAWDDVETLPATLQEGAKKTAGQLRTTTNLWKSRVLRTTQKSAKGVLKKLEHGVELWVHGLGLASRGDIRRIETRIQKIQKRLRALEKGA